MSELLKIFGIGLCAVLLTALLKPYRPEFALAVSLAGGCAVMGLIIKNAMWAFNSIKGTLNDFGVPQSTLALCLKAVGIAYIAETLAALARDNGQSAIALKITFAAKISLVMLCLPSLNTLLRLAVSFL